MEPTSHSAILQQPPILQAFANLTANLVFSLFPFNQLIKLIHLAPRKHDETKHNRRSMAPANRQRDPIDSTAADHDQLLMLPEHRSAFVGLTITPNTQQQQQQQHTSTTGANNLVTNWADRARRRLTTRQLTTTTVPKLSKTTRLPRVTHSDLFNIHQIHAASLNGLAGQFGGQPASSQPAASSANEIVGQMPALQPQEPQQQQARKPSQSNSVSQFALPDGQQAPGSGGLGGGTQLAPRPAAGQTRQPQDQAVVAGLGGALPASLAPPSTGTSGPQQPQLSLLASNAHTQSPSSTPPATRQQAPATNNQKFAFMGAPQQPAQVSGATGSQLGYDSSSLATTNSISVHSSAGAGQLGPAGSLPLATSLSASTAPLLTSTPTPGGPPSATGHHLHHHHSHHPSAGSTSVLASFSPPIRSSHANNLANTKYSLDGIIAVAIFGGFIFLGAIITILVIIIRR